MARLEDGRTNFALDLIRPATLMPGQEAFALLEMRLNADYATDKALAYLRAQNPEAVLSQATLSNWEFRLASGPATVKMPPELLRPMQMASNDLGTARLVMRLSIEGGFILDRLLRDGAATLGAIAEAEMKGISPRVGAVVRFNTWDLMEALLSQAPSNHMLSWTSLVDLLIREAGRLPIQISGQVDPGQAAAYGEALADRLIARYGSYVSSDGDTLEPCVALPELDTVDDTEIRWSLSEAFLASRRVILRFDLLSDLQRLIAGAGVDTFVRQHTAMELPSLGRSDMLVFAHLPAERVGVAALGANLTFPPNPPYRPHAKSVTVLLEPPDDIVQAEVQLAPGEAVSYDYATFAVISDEHGVRQVDGPHKAGADSPLRLSPDDFPIDFVLVEATHDLALLATIDGECRYEREGRQYKIPFRLDSGRLSASLALPKDGQSVHVVGTMTARAGGSRLPLGPFESRRIRLDVSSFAEYGWHEAEIDCDFSAGSSLHAIDLLPAGYPESFENITILAFTPDQPRRRFGWFAASPFMPGFRYRPHRADDPRGSWRDVAYPVDRLVVYPERAVTFQESAAVALARPPMRPSANGNGHARPVSETSEPTTGGRLPEGVPISPQEEATDTILYSYAADPARKLYIPRYHLDEQTVSGRQRYRIAMAQQGPASTLTVHLVKGPAESLGDEARDAQEFPHDPVITLDFLQAPPAGARKILRFEEVTKNGPIVTATLRFATLEERDEVYRALTEDSRNARLIVKRVIQVAIPQSAPAASGPLWGGVVNWNAILARRSFNALVQPTSLVSTNLMMARLQPGTPELSRSMAVFERGALEKNMLADMAFVQPAALTTTMFKPKTDLTDMVFVPPKAVDTLWLKPIDVLQPIDVLNSSLPVPVLAFEGTEGGQDNGRVQVNLSVTNWQDFSGDFFQAAPDLAPCGKNQNASRTWVDIYDAATNTRLYGFCALNSPGGLAKLWFSAETPQAVPERVYVRLHDRRTGVAHNSNTVETRSPEPPRPWYQEVVRELDYTVQPTPFAFSTALHDYIFQGITPGSTGGGLVRYRLRWKGRVHTYLQDTTHPSLVYYFPDDFKIARRSEPPFTPFITVRVVSRTNTDDTEVAFDYTVAPYTDPMRIEEAGKGLLADPRFGAADVEFQPFITSDVKFFLDRPAERGTVKEERSGVSLVLQGGLKDSLAMNLADFRVLFDAMHLETASLFLGRFEIGVPGENPEVIPFTARLDDLMGELFLYQAGANGDGSIHVSLTNAIESPIQIDDLQATVRVKKQVSAAVIQDLALPVVSLAPGGTVEMKVVPARPLPASGTPEVIFDLEHVKVVPDPEAIWNAILDRATLEFFDTITVNAVGGLFDPIPDRANDQIVAIMVEFQGGGTAKLSAAQLSAQVRIDYPIDDVILRRPIGASYRYTVTVIRADNRQERDKEPREGSAREFFVEVNK